MSKAKFGGGSVSPAVVAHTQKVTVATSSKTSAAASPKIGGGCISPSISSHLAKKIGGGMISPTVAAHLAKRNIAKK